MTAFQLSLFPDEPPIPLSSLNKKPKIKSQIRIIESCCSTQRAADLLGISTSTLYRVRKQGKIYQTGPWSAKSLNANAWEVSHTTVESH